MRERHGEGHSPLETERKAPDKLVLRAPDALRKRRARRTEGSSCEGPVLLNGHVVVEAERLRHISHSATSAHRRERTEEKCFAARGAQQPEQEPDEGGLPRTVRPEEPETSPLLTARSTESTAVKAPKCLATPRVSASTANGLDLLLVRQASNDDGVLEAGLQRFGPLRENIRRGPHPPGGPPPP